MLDDAGPVRDDVNFSELPPERQKEYQIFVLQNLILKVMLYLKDEVPEFLKNKQISRDLALSEPSLAETSHNPIPSPAQLRELIRPDTLWVVRLSEYQDVAKAFSLAEELAKLVVR